MLEATEEKSFTEEKEHTEEEEEAEEENEKQKQNQNQNPQQKYWGCCPCTEGVGGVVHLGISFFLCFFSYNVVQNFQTALNKELGYISVGLLYVVFAASSFVAPSVVYAIGEKWCLVIGAACYAPFVAANAYPVAALMIPTAAVVGFGASLLWTAHGAAVLLCAGNKGKLGSITGLFFGIYQTNQLFGNGFAAVSIGFGIKDWVLFLIFTGVLLVGVLSLVFIRLPKPLPPEDGVEPQKLTFKQRFFGTLFMLGNKRILCLILPMVFGGTNQTFSGGKFPAVCGKKYLGYMMACFGVVDVLGSIVTGRLNDNKKIGKRPLIALTGVLCLGGTALTSVAYWLCPDPASLTKTAIGLLFVAAVFLGLLDACVSNIMYSTIGLLFPPDKSTFAFGAYRVIGATVTGIWFAVGAYVPLYALAGIVVALAVAFVVDLFLLDRFVTPLDAWRTTNTNDAIELKSPDSTTEDASNETGSMLETVVSEQGDGDVIVSQ